MVVPGAIATISDVRAAPGSYLMLTRYPQLTAADICLGCCGHAQAAVQDVSEDAFR